MLLPQSRPALFEQRVDRRHEHQRDERRGQQPADDDARQRRLQLAAFADARAPSARGRASSPATSSESAAAACVRRASTASRSGMLVAAPQDVGVVHEQDRVADDDAGQHDDADVGLQVERRAGQLERQHDADGGDRHREHDDERIAQRLVLRRHDGVDEHEREDQHQPQLR